MKGPGSYGRNDAGDATMDAAVLSRAVGKPVRVLFFFQEDDGIRPGTVTGVQTCALPIYPLAVVGLAGAPPGGAHLAPPGFGGGQIAGHLPAPGVLNAIVEGMGAPAPLVNGRHQPIDSTGTELRLEQGGFGLNPAVHLLLERRARRPEH